MTFSIAKIKNKITLLHFYQKYQKFSPKFNAIPFPFSTQIRYSSDIEKLQLKTNNAGELGTKWQKIKACVYERLDSGNNV
jgi:hypothetical protein